MKNILIITVLAFLIEIPVKVKALEIVRGQITQGGLLILKTTPGSNITINGKKILVSGRGFAVTGFHRDDTTRLTIKAIRPDGIVKELRVKPSIRQYPKQRINGLPKQMVTPGPEFIRRINHERKKVLEARLHSSKLEAFADKFCWPLLGIITGVYGSNRVLNGKSRTPHYGVDIAASSGEPIIAPQAGIVRMVSNLYYTGWTIIIDHGHGLSSTFLHLKSTFVKIGDTVIKGQQIGTVGSTGRSTGPHLDWRINLFRKRLDPALVAGPMPSN